MPACSLTIPLNVSTRPSSAPASSSGSVATPFSSRRSASATSKSSPGMSSTILPNIWTNRRYESYAKRSLAVCFARPCTEASLSPRLRTVSIIPGIENGAPERTETRSGSTSSPRRLPIFCSSAVSASATSSISPSGSRSPAAMYALHASVVIVNPGGTGRPRFVISARLAPLPPSRNFWSLLPSSKAKTYFMGGLPKAVTVSPTLLRASLRSVASNDDAGVTEAIHQPDARVDEQPRDAEQQRDHQPEGSRQPDDEHDRHDVAQAGPPPGGEIPRVGIDDHDVGEPLAERLSRACRGHHEVQVEQHEQPGDEGDDDPDRVRVGGRDERADTQIHRAHGEEVDAERGEAATDRGGLGARDAHRLAPLRTAAIVAGPRLPTATATRRYRRSFRLLFFELGLGVRRPVGQPSVIALALEGIGQHLPRGAEARRLGAGAVAGLIGPSLLHLGAQVLEPFSVRGADLFLRRVRLDAQQLVMGLGHGRRSSRWATSLSIGTRSWVIESRSRTVTARSSRVSKSTVTQSGV